MTLDLCVNPTVQEQCDYLCGKDIHCNALSNVCEAFQERLIIKDNQRNQHFRYVLEGPKVKLRICFSIPLNSSVKS